MSRRLIYILAAVGGLAVACAIFFAVVLGGALTLTQGVADSGEAFMSALQAQNLDAAYDMFAPDLQAEITYAEFEATFGGADFSAWSFTSRAVENNFGRVSGTATIDGNPFEVRLEFINNEAGWQILGYDFAPAG